MKKIIGIFSILFILIAFFSQKAEAQEKWIYEKQIGQRTPAPYQPVREADVMWAKKIWRLVDLREKMNHHLYYPTEPKGDWHSLIDVILGEIKSGTVNAYDAAEGDDMTVVITQADIDTKFGATIDTIEVEDPNNPGIYTLQIVKTDASSSEVKQYIIQEIWYFENKLSALQVKIIGLCPIRISYNSDLESYQKRKLFWIYYPDFRTTFANHESYNRNNDAHRISYDDAFLQRRFSSYVQAESNVYDNRDVTEYETGRGALLESEKIKEAIFNMEQDLWEY